MIIIIHIKIEANPQLLIFIYINLQLNQSVKLSLNCKKDYA